MQPSRTWLSADGHREVQFIPSGLHANLDIVVRVRLGFFIASERRCNVSIARSLQVAKSCLMLSEHAANANALQPPLPSA